MEVIASGLLASGQPSTTATVIGLQRVGRAGLPEPLVGATVDSKRPGNELGIRESSSFGSLNPTDPCCCRPKSRSNGFSYSLTPGLKIACFKMISQSSHLLRLETWLISVPLGRVLSRDISMHGASAIRSRRASDCLDPIRLAWRVGPLDTPDADLQRQTTAPRRGFQKI